MRAQETRIAPGLAPNVTTPKVMADPLVLADSGMRPKLRWPGEPVRDFMLQRPEAHSTPGLMNVYGIESPG